MNFRPSELRVLEYLDQRGPTHRQDVAADTVNLRKGRYAPAALTRMAGKLTFRLREAGLIEDKRDRQGFHIHYEVTAAGRAAMRSGS